MAGQQELITALDLAEAGDWEGAHAIVQKYEDDAVACWLHAVVHKIEGDESNSRYWYRRSGRGYGDFSDVPAELAAIRATVGKPVI